MDDESFSDGSSFTPSELTRTNNKKINTNIGQIKKGDDV